MPKLRLHRTPARAEEAHGGETPDVLRFPVEAARSMGRGGAGLLDHITSDESGDVITEIEQTLDRMQDRLDDLSDQIGSLRFPGTGPGGGGGPNAA